MRKQVLLEQFQRRLVELDYPERKLRRTVEELSDHHDNLKRTALKEGLSEDEAESRANVQLGNPVAQAEEISAAQKRFSWWSRHPLIGFILLPILSIGPALVATFLGAVIVISFFVPPNQFNTLLTASGNFVEIRRLLLLLFAVQYVVLTVWAMLACWIARFTGAGLRWATVACLVFAFQGAFFHFHLSTRQSGFGYDSLPDIWGAAGPLLIAASGYLRRWLRLRRFAPLPEQSRNRPFGWAAFNELLNTPLGAKRAGNLEKPSSDWFKKALRTPTYWFIVILLAIFLPLFALGSAAAAKKRVTQRVSSQDLKQKTWPAEREAVVQELESRQGTRETFHETTIDLSSHINTKLSESTDGNKGLKDNHLLELPRGNHVYAGIPFDVQGRIQLMGGGLEKWKRVFPAVVRDIKVGQKCGKIHLFHGENCSWDNSVQNATVARLVLHYADGSMQQLEIKSGVHLLDWWGIIYTTDAPKPKRFISSPDSELAWVGKNPWIKRYQPEMSLRLYKSTFDNPQPDVEITSIDYASTMTSAAPFMLAMTIE